MGHILFKNSSALYEPLIDSKKNLLLPLAQANVERQSSSVTPSGYLGEILSLYIQNDKLPLLRHDRGILYEDIKRRQKHFALVQLLDSWKKEDEEEQLDTWEQLKQALDADRISDRKLFP